MGLHSVFGMLLCTHLANAVPRKAHEVQASGATDARNGCASPHALRRVAALDIGTARVRLPPMAGALAFRCASCGAFNRMTLLVPGREAVCGRCKAALDTSGQPTPILPGQFDAAVANAPVPLLVDFWAPWCGPCRAMAPALEALGRTMAGRIVVGKLNVDDAPEIAGRLRIQGVPTVALFRGGNEVERLVGARGLEELRRFVESATLSVGLA